MKPETVEDRVEHTPGPWVIPHGDDNGHVICEGDDPQNPGRILFVLRNPWGTSRVLSFEELSAHADFIVRACNSHDDLVKALENASANLGEAFHSALRKASDHEAASRAHKAIADIPPREWSNVILFVLEGLGIDAALTKASVR